MNDVQNKLLEMLSWFDAFCEDNNLRYFIVEGTVIGAARHKGFIPWDDDIDVGMPRTDYDRFINMCDTIKGKYSLETPYSDNPDYICPWSKLYDTTTTKIEKARRQIKFGLYIDIFPLDGMGDTLAESTRNYRRIDKLNMLWATRVCAIRKGRGIGKNIAIIISRLIPQFVLNDKKLVRYIDKQCKRVEYDSSKYVACSLSTYRNKEIMELRVYGKPSKYRFENINVYGPELYDEYLTKIYGNWRELPPEEKRVSQHDYIYLNLNEPYKIVDNKG